MTVTKFCRRYEKGVILLAPRDYWHRYRARPPQTDYDYLMRVIECSRTARGKRLYYVQREDDERMYRHMTFAELCDYARDAFGIDLETEIETRREERKRTRLERRRASRNRRKAAIRAWKAAKIAESEDFRRRRAESEARALRDPSYRDFRLAEIALDILHKQGRDAPLNSWEDAVALAARLKI